MRNATLCFVTREDRVLLGLKKRGFGEGRLNGFGGKVGPRETVEAAARRELFEECGIRALELESVGELQFTFKEKVDWDQVVHVFKVKAYLGTPRESEEMARLPYPRDALPYDEMWEDDRYWLPLVLDGKRVKGRFVFDGETERMLDMVLEAF